MSSATNTHVGVREAIKRIYAEVKPHKKRLIVVAIAGAVMAGAETGGVILIKNVFDGLQANKMEFIYLSLGGILALAIVKGISRYFHLYNMNFTAELVAQDLRKKLQRKFMALNLSFYNQYSSGSGGLISRILNDIMTIFYGLRMYADLFRAPVLFLGLLGWITYLNWKLTLSIFFVLPLVVIFLRQISKSIKKYSRRGQEDLEKITSTIKETLDGVRTIQAFNLENEMGKKFERESEQFLHSRSRIHRLIEGAGPITEFVMTLVIFFILLYMISQITTGKASFGDFMSYITALLSIGAPVKMFQDAYVRIQETSVAAGRVFSLIDEISVVPQNESPVPFPVNWKKIEFQNISFRYGENWVLKDVSITVARGEVVALVGESGSGKSTLVNLLGRFFDPTSGHILIDGVPIQNLAVSDLREHIALVSQDVFLFSDSIARNIWAGDFSKNFSLIEPAAKHANAHNFIQRLPQSYDSPVGDRGSLLSGGEKQRISIARAFLKDAPILILDEATSALDSSSELEVQKGLDRLLEGRTAFVIAHRFSTIARADRIYVLKNGELIEQGHHSELIESSLEYSRLYRLQML